MKENDLVSLLGTTLNFEVQLPDQLFLKEGFSVNFMVRDALCLTNRELLVNLIWKNFNAGTIYFCGFQLANDDPRPYVELEIDGYEAFLNSIIHFNCHAHASKGFWFDKAFNLVICTDVYNEIILVGNNCNPNLFNELWSVRKDELIFSSVEIYDWVVQKKNPNYFSMDFLEKLYRNYFAPA